MQIDMRFVVRMMFATRDSMQTRSLTKKLFMVKIYDNNHVCSLVYEENEDYKQASSWVVDNVIKYKCDSITHIYKLKEIMHDFRVKYVVTISYNKA